MFDLLLLAALVVISTRQLHRKQWNRDRLRRLLKKARRATPVVTHQCIADLKSLGGDAAGGVRDAAGDLRRQVRRGKRPRRMTRPTRRAGRHNSPPATRGTVHVPTPPRP